MGPSKITSPPGGRAACTATNTGAHKSTSHLSSSLIDVNSVSYELENWVEAQINQMIGLRKSATDVANL